MADLQDLVQHRRDILLAEVAAWLHDVGKILLEHVESQLDGGSFSWPRDQAYKIVIKNLSTKIRFSSSIDSFRKPEIVNTIRANPSPTAADYLPLDLTRWCANERIQICNESFILGVLISLGTPGFATHPNRTQLFQNLGDWLPAFLGVCHHIAHHDKQEPPRGEGIPQYPKSFFSSPFGYDRLWIDLQDSAKVKKYKGLLGTLFKNFETLPIEEKFFRIRTALKMGLGDTRWPINEVSLYNWGATVAALFKSGVAYCIYKGQFQIDKRLDWQTKIVDTDIRWRLLSIRTDGLEYLLSAPSIPDLLARKDLLTDAWNRVQRVLEEEYPLALEVYRDENGPVFVVPDLENLLDLANSADNNKTLREYILEAFRQGTVKEDPRLAINGEIVPYFKVDKKPWKGQPAPQELPPIGEHLKTTPILQSDPEAVAQSWRHLSEPREVCTVCGLRPQEPSEKAMNRGMCDVCEERRANRPKAWVEGASLSSEERLKQGKPETVWLDEVADRNGRLALIVGTFDLSHWLDGTLVQSLAVFDPQKCKSSNPKCPQKTYKFVAKNPSFARLRRIWETTRRFWQNVAPTETPPKELQDFCNSQGLDLKDLWKGPLSLEESLAGEAMSEKLSRLFLKGKQTHGNLAPFHAYEMIVQGRKVAVLWVPPDATDEQGKPLQHRGGFWVIENLEYLRKQFGKDFQEVLQEGTPYDVYEPSDYGRPGRAMAQFVVGEKKNGPEYTPLIPILAEPRTFMALVPADRAVDVVRAIKAKYEREMGKVRNRLPLHLGIVFADAHQPLRTILDAGRRMLRQEAKPLKWKVHKVKTFGDLNNPNDCKGLRALRLLGQEHLLEEQPEQFAKVHCVVLTREESEVHNRITWYVPAVMGDGQTKDHWYPYVYWVRDRDGKTDPAQAKRNRYYQAPNPFNPDTNGNPQPGWLVHARELKQGDIIYFTPATLDFIWLDHGGRRFEIAYDQKGRRHGTLHRPYLLDELEELEACWKLLAGDPEEKVRRLSTTQLLAVRDLIETKRAEWFEQPEKSLRDQTFEAFCKDVLTNAQWATRPQKDEMERLTCWAVTGLLADAVELFYHILKQRPASEEEGTL